MAKHKAELTNDEYIAALNAQCRKLQRRGACNDDCLYIGWCEKAYKAFWAARDYEPVILVRGVEDGLQEKAGCEG
jgi:hypothetical protein